MEPFRLGPYQRKRKEKEALSKPDLAAHLKERQEEESTLTSKPAGAWLTSRQTLTISCGLLAGFMLGMWASLWVCAVQNSKSMWEGMHRLTLQLTSQRSTGPAHALDQVCHSIPAEADQSTSVSQMGLLAGRPLLGGMEV
eukprot:1155431-Pelagomonas_calceolata.AAC.2